MTELSCHEFFFTSIYALQAFTVIPQGSIITDLFYTFDCMHSNICFGSVYFLVSYIFYFYTNYNVTTVLP